MNILDASLGYRSSTTLCERRGLNICKLIIYDFSGKIIFHEVNESVSSAETIESRRGGGAVCVRYKE
jgi:hypothetical protein